MDKIKYSYNGKFKGSILIVGRTGCGKTTFIQNLAKNKLFGELTEICWISKIPLSEERENNIEDSFEQEVNFNYPNIVEDFDYLIDVYKQRKAEYVDSTLGEKMIIDKLIVMDDVSGLADKSGEFANFLQFRENTD